MAAQAVDGLRLPLAVVRGAGDLATGVVQALKLSGFPLVALETAQPTAIRRQVALSSVMYEQDMGKGFAVENLLAMQTPTALAALQLADSRQEGRYTVPVLVDPMMDSLAALQPGILVDAIIAKKNLGLHTGLSPLVIALGPGFTAGQDAHVVIETLRGHQLGRHIHKGQAQPNTGLPGLVAGQSQLRVIHAPTSGKLRILRDIGQAVEAGETIALVGDTAVVASISGLVRGMLPPGFPVRQGMKMADLDPRLSEKDNCATISDKARALGSSVAVACFHHLFGQKEAR